MERGRRGDGGMGVSKLKTPSSQASLGLSVEHGGDFVPDQRMTAVFSHAGRSQLQIGNGHRQSVAASIELVLRVKGSGARMARGGEAERVGRFIAQRRLSVWIILVCIKGGRRK
jgi:hypothetical protein